MNIKIKTTRVRKGFIWLTVPSSGLSPRKSQGRDWNRDHRGKLFTGVLSSSQMASFVFLRTILPKALLSIAGWALPHQPFDKKMPLRHACGPIRWRHLPRWRSFFSMILTVSSWQNKKNKETTTRITTNTGFVFPICSLRIYSTYLILLKCSVGLGDWAELAECFVSFEAPYCTVIP